MESHSRFAQASYRGVLLLPHKGQRHVAWGVSPRLTVPHNPRAPKGRRQSLSKRRPAVAPSGLWGSLGVPFLGLAPQATCLCPFGAKIQDHHVFRRIAEEPRPNPFYSSSLTDLREAGRQGRRTTLTGWEVRAAPAAAPRRPAESASRTARSTRRRSRPSPPAPPRGRSAPGDGTRPACCR